MNNTELQTPEAELFKSFDNMKLLNYLQFTM